jgi:uncharacterized repeat protein (TIGR01451 family)
MPQKLYVLALLAVLFSPQTFAQLPSGSLCPSINTTDIYGNPVDLFSMLNNGEEVILIFGAYWSGPVGDYIATEAVQNYYYWYGPFGTGQVNAIYIEADPLATLEDINNSGFPNSINFPIVDDPGNLLEDFEISYFPTVYRVCTSGILQLIDQLTFSQLENTALNNCTLLSSMINPSLSNLTIGYDCNEATLSVQLTNFGIQPLEACIIEVTSVNGINQTIDWTGYLNQGDTEFVVLGALDATQSDIITVMIASDDEQMEAPISVTLMPAGNATSHIRIDVLTDDWPEEITWSIYNSSMELIVQNDPYTQQQFQYIHDINLSALDCYTFTIEDSFGDGLAWPGGVLGHINIMSVEEDGDEVPLYTYNGDYQFSLESGSFQVLQLVPVSISGKVYLDANENAYPESDEIGLGGIAVHLDDMITYTDENGNYIFNDVEASSTLYIEYDQALYPNATTPSVIDLTNVTQYTYNFGLSTNDPNYNLNYVYTEPWFFCGFDGTIWFSVYNSGNTTANGQVTIQLDELLTGVSGYPVGYTVVGNSYTWDLTSMSPGEWQYYSIQIVNPGFEFMGQEITNYLTLLTYNAEAELMDTDQGTHASTLYCSYDPNDKVGTPEGLTEEHFIPNGTDLEYRIRFQNTGNYQAFNIHVRDTLDTDLDWSTFSIIGTSHNCQPTIDMSTGAIDFFFPDINLPDSTSNEPESHGFIRYRVSPLPNLPELTTIDNTAYIYFDFNPAIITNTTLHTISDLYSGVPELTEQQLIIYPNPCNDQIQLKIPAGLNQYSVIMRDIQGRLVKRIESHTPDRLIIPCADIAEGSYWIELIDNQQYQVKPTQVIIQR